MAARKDLSLRWLEIFQLCAEAPSLQSAADAAGLSTSTVSHHIQSLEAFLGAKLFDHSKRPMVLTPVGEIFLRKIEAPVRGLRQAQAEAATAESGKIQSLRIGSIEDIDSDIAPELAVALSAELPGCAFTYYTDTSREVLRRVQDRKLDLGLVADPPEQLFDLQQRPLLRDPFVLALPNAVTVAPPDVLAGGAALPFLRFGPGQIISQQIEAQLRRMQVNPPHGFACGNSQTLLAMVAGGAGWTITTPLLFARGRRFHDNAQMHPFPGKRFARRLSLVATSDCPPEVLDRIEAHLRRLLQSHALQAMHRTAPWLEAEFRLLP